MELIRIYDREIGGHATNSVDARELWLFLGVGKDYTTWIKDRIAKYNFAEHADFEVFPNFGENPLGGRPAKAYVISIDMAKELCMVENNDKGREARLYFLECERKAKSAPSMDIASLVANPHEMLRLIAEYGKKSIEQQETITKQTIVIEEQRPQVDALQRISAANGATCLRDAAKELQMRPTDLNAWLLKNRWIYRRPGCGKLIAYQDKLTAGVLEMKVSTYSNSNGEDRISEQTLVTPKGLAKLAVILSAETSAKSDKNLQIA